ncbi:hypothetical protein BDR04DRAFT_1040123 [Suillus decipiens]|nr:hypothetical protein BDR04DRAFT_1040123 [Suillus decipiens]
MDGTPYIPPTQHAILDAIVSADHLWNHPLTSSPDVKGHPIFKLKHDQHGAPICFKARYVCCGYSAVCQHLLPNSSLSISLHISVLLWIGK